MSLCQLSADYVFVFEFKFASVLDEIVPQREFFLAMRENRIELNFGCLSCRIPILFQVMLWYLKKSVQIVKF